MKNLNSLLFRSRTTHTPREAPRSPRLRRNAHKHDNGPRHRRSDAELATVTQHVQHDTSRQQRQTGHQQKCPLQKPHSHTLFFVPAGTTRADHCLTGSPDTHSQALPLLLPLNLHVPTGPRTTKAPRKRPCPFPRCLTLSSRRRPFSPSKKRRGTSLLTHFFERKIWNRGLYALLP